MRQPGPDAVVPQSHSKSNVPCGEYMMQAGYGRPGMYLPPKVEYNMAPYPMEGRHLARPEAVDPNYPMPMMYQGHPGPGDMQHGGYPLPIPPGPIPYDPRPELPGPMYPQQTPSAVSARQQRKQIQAQAAQKASQKIPSKRKGAPQNVSSDDEGDLDSDDDCEVPELGKEGSAADIAKDKYNHIEDEKERKRLKRLLRNRVSAQQARERKKAYLSTLESRSKDIETRNAELEQKVTTLERENFMLRQVVKATTKKNSPE